jgi:hypothetical protein
MTGQSEGLRCLCDHKNRHRAARPRDEWTEVRVQSRPSASIIEGARRLAARRAELTGRAANRDEAVSWVEHAFERGGYTRQLGCDVCGRSERLTVDEIQALADWATTESVPYILLKDVRRVLEHLGTGNMAE